MSQLTYEDYKSRLKMQDLLTDAGYAQNKRDGLRYRRIRVMTAWGGASAVTSSSSRPTATTVSSRQ